jgi:hypothetical protein
MYVSDAAAPRRARGAYASPLFAADEGPPPRVWTALTAGVIAIPVALAIGTVIVDVVAVTERGPQVLENQQQYLAWHKAYAETRSGLAGVFLPSQLVFFIMALVAAYLSPRPFALRLGLQRGDFPVWTWGVFILATPVVGIISALLVSWTVETCQSLNVDVAGQIKLMEDLQVIMRTHADGFLVGLFVLVAVIPGLVEELMFRGYVQIRLAERWHPAAAITTSAVVFSLAHLVPLYAIGLLPLGLWLGVVAWRTGSTWPAILCHMVNNGVAVLAAKYQVGGLGIPWDTMTMVNLSISVPAFLISIHLFRRG